MDRLAQGIAYGKLNQRFAPEQSSLADDRLTTALVARVEDLGGAYLTALSSFPTANADNMDLRDVKSCG